MGERELPAMAQPVRNSSELGSAPALPGGRDAAGVPPVSHYSMDISEHLPLRLGCRASLWDGSVYLYRGRSECVTIVPLKAGEMPTPELMVQRVGLGTW